MVSFGPNAFPNFVRSLLRQAQAAGEASLSTSSSDAGMGTLPADGLQVPRVPLSQILSGPQSLISAEETVLFLKTLLKLPSEMEALLLLLAASPDALKSDTLKELLALFPDQTLSVEMLQSLLTDRSQEGVQKLMKFLQGQVVSMGKEQKSFGDMLQHLNTLSTHANASPQQALRTLILLYLPWYPLVPPQQLDISFAPPDEDESEGAAEIAFSLVLFLETNLLGKFKIALGLAQKTQLIVKLEHDAAAQPYLADIEGKTQESSSKEGLPPPVFVYQERSASVLKTASIDAGMPQTAKRAGQDHKKLAIQPVTGVSVLVIYLAHTLARTIFELDDRLNLLQHRQQQI